MAGDGVGRQRARRGWGGFVRCTRELAGEPDIVFQGAQVPSATDGEPETVKLIVLLKGLKERAARHQRSAEAEHRAILQQILLCLRRRSPAQVLASMPDVGYDADFARVDETNPAPVFD